jgi:hypothetical protein
MPRLLARVVVSHDLGSTAFDSLGHKLLAEELFTHLLDVLHHEQGSSLEHVLQFVYDEQVIQSSPVFISVSLGHNVLKLGLFTHFLATLQYEQP